MEAKAIRLAAQERSDLYPFIVDGKIEAADVEHMASVMEQAFAAHDEVDVMVIVRHWDGLTLGAAFDPKALKAQAEGARKIRRYAVVGAPGWAETMIELMAPLSPVDAKTFGAGEEAAARAWIDRPEEA